MCQDAAKWPSLDHANLTARAFAAASAALEFDAVWLIPWMRNSGFGGDATGKRSTVVVDKPVGNNKGTARSSYLSGLLVGLHRK